jgi:16S rRNA (guanine527-N7)-methyltransferase
MQDLIGKYFPGLTSFQSGQFKMLGQLYQDWNARINVISRQDIDNLYERHVLHSLGIAKVLQFKPGTRVLDAGTGGGFPGIPLAILFPEVSFYLVDSTAKKLSVVKAIAYETGLKNVMTGHSRLEDHPGKYDYVVSRAVASLDQMTRWVWKNVIDGGFNEIPNGMLCLKGGEIEGELKSMEAWWPGGMVAWRQGGLEAGKQGSKEAGKIGTIEQLNNRTPNYKIYYLSDYFSEPYFSTKVLIHLFSREF